MANIEQLLGENSARVSLELEKYLKTPEKEVDGVYDAMRYSALSGGKRIRPFLVRSFAELFGGTEEKAIAYECAIELIHVSSLIYDDMPCMDNDDYRRGKLTNHKVYGEALAVLSGDAMNMKAFEIAASNDKTSVESRLRAVLLLSGLAGGVGMIGGQHIDIISENKKVDFDSLLNMHSKKTGALIRASALLGCCAAELNDPSDERVKNAERYAAGIGLAFQIKDDILDVEGDEKILGKAVHADEKLDKTTFLSFMSIDEAKEYAKRETEKAIDCIKQYNGSEVLTELACWLLNRNK